MNTIKKKKSVSDCFTSQNKDKKLNFADAIGWLALKRGYEPATSFLIGVCI